MVHQMFGAHFVNTSQNKDNLLIYSKKICKSSYKMQKNVISFFCTLIFLSNSQKFTYEGCSGSSWNLVIKFSNIVIILSFFLKYHRYT